MSTPPYETLLNNALSGTESAQVTWGAYVQSKLFNTEELKQTREMIEPLLSSNDPIKKGNALNLKGFMHLNGVGGPKNENEAISLFNQAIELKNVAAMGNRAYMHMNGIGGPKNSQIAIQLYMRAIDQGSTLTMIQLANMYRYGIEVPEDIKKAIQLYERASDLGDGNAMNELAEITIGFYVPGITAPPKDKDLQKAIQLYERAINLGSTQAMYKLAHMFQYGIGMPKNEQKAIQLYDQAIALDNKDAMVTRANLYSAEKNYKKAFELLIKADKLGHPFAKFKIGSLKVLEQQDANLELGTQRTKHAPSSPEISRVKNIKSEQISPEITEKQLTPCVILSGIVSTLIDNIEKKSNGRWTSGANSEKIARLETLKSALIKNKDLDKNSNEYQQYLIAIMKVCEMKRHSYHFWKTPESVNEFLNLLKTQGISLPSNDMKPKT